jgi:hypothetical protein
LFRAYGAFERTRQERKFCIALRVDGAEVRVARSGTAAVPLLWEKSEDKRAGRMPALQKNDVAMCAKNRAIVLHFILRRRLKPMLLNYKFRMSASVRRA